MTADQELDRVVAWLRREALETAKGLERCRSGNARRYLERVIAQKRDIAARLARHEHRSEADG